MRAAARRVTAVMLTTVMFGVSAEVVRAAEPAPPDFDKLCSAGNGWACYQAGTRESVQGAKARALELNWAACRNETPAGCVAMRDLLDGGLPPGGLVAELQLRERECADGNGRSCLAAGHLRWNGPVDSREDPRAIALFERACALDAWACSGVGLVAKLGLGPPAEARALFEKACRAQNASGGCRLGAEMGSGSAESDELPLLELACKGRDPLACSSLAYRHLSPARAQPGDAPKAAVGAPQDLAKARALFEDACALGDALACVGQANLMLGRIAGRAEVPPAQATLNAAYMLAAAACGVYEVEGCTLTGEGLTFWNEDEAKRTKGVEVLAWACGQSSARACGLLGAARLRGIGQPADPVEGQSLLERACGDNDLKACGVLGVALATGKLGTGVGRAVGLLRDACDGGNFDSCKSLARLFRSWRAPADDAKDVKALLDRACGAGDTEACAEAKAKPSPPKGTPQDRFTKALWGCSAGDGEACHAASESQRRDTMFVLRGAVEGPYDLSIKACNLGSARGCARAAKDYETGRQSNVLGEVGAVVFGSGAGTPAPVDMDRAQALYTRACQLDAGQCGAGAHLADHVDPVRGAALRGVACDAGNGSMCYQLGMKSSSDEEKVGFYRRACELDELMACNGLLGLAGSARASLTARELEDVRARVKRLTSM